MIYQKLENTDNYVFLIKTNCQEFITVGLKKVNVKTRSFAYVIVVSGIVNSNPVRICITI